MVQNTKGQRIFRTEKNPLPQEVSGKEGYYSIPYWNILGYLENVATKNAKTPNEEITELLVETINSIIDHRDKEDQRIQNYRTDWMMIKTIFKLPLERIRSEHIEFIDTALNSKWDTTLIASEIKEKVVPYLIQNKAADLILKLLEVILDYKNVVPKPLSEFNSIMGDYWLYETFESHRSEIIRLCGIRVANIALKKIGEIIDIDERQFNQAIIPAIEDHPQTIFPDKYECQLIYVARDTLEFSDPDAIKPVLYDLSKEKHPIFRRILIHAINHHYDKLQELFWNWDGNPLDEYGCKHEIYELLKSNSASFSGEQMEKVLEWIEQKHYHIRDEHKKDPETAKKLLAYLKREWLLALLQTKHPKVIRLHEISLRINPEEIEHPGFDIWYGTGGILRGEPEPFKKELLTETNEKIAEYLIRYKEDKERRLDEELAGSFRRSVRENPIKFSKDMLPFLGVPREYQYGLLMGLSEAWNSGKDYPWDELLDFMIQTVKANAFWEEEYEKSFDYRNWIVGAIANVIENGTRDDKHAFDEKLLPGAEKILLILGERAESDLSDMGDLVNSVLNSTKGKIFKAMISYSLRCARSLRKESGEKWVKSIKEYFTKCLDREYESSLEFSVTLGEYLAYLYYYLDREWVIDNINRIFPKDKDGHWQAAFTGYLFFASRLSKDLYLLLRDNFHYTKALQTKFDDRIGLGRTVQHIGVGYLQGFEELDDEKSLINQLLGKKNSEQLLALVRFFWRLRDKLTDEPKRKIKPIWKRLFEILSENQENLGYQEVMSNLSRWLALIDELDDQSVEWLKLSAKYIKDIEAMSFIEYLLKHATKAPDKVGEIYLEMLNSGIFPRYKQENIKELVRTLYQHSQEEVADRICNSYLDRGFEFLTTVYEKHMRP